MVYTISYSICSTAYTFSICHCMLNGIYVLIYHGLNHIISCSFMIHLQYLPCLQQPPLCSALLVAASTSESGLLSCEVLLNVPCAFAQLTINYLRFLLPRVFPFSLHLTISLPHSDNVHPPSPTVATHNKTQ